MNPSMPAQNARPRRFDLIAFDWDGTLFDSTAIIVRCIQAAVRDVGGTVPPTSAMAFCIACTIRAVESNRVPSQSKAKRAIGWAVWMMLGCMVG